MSSFENSFHAVFDVRICPHRSLIISLLTLGNFYHNLYIIAFHKKPRAMHGSSDFNLMSNIS